MNKHFRPSDVPPLFPYLTVIDGKASLEFYKAAFGFTLRSEPVPNEQGGIHHCEMAFHDAIIMFGAEGTWAGSDMKSPKTLGVPCSLNLYVYCPDTDAMYKRAIGAGAVSKAEPNDGFWGDRFCVVEDINGYTWTFATTLAK